MKRAYVIVYDTMESVNNKFETVAEFSQDAINAFFCEVDENDVTYFHLIEGDIVEDEDF